MYEKEKLEDYIKCLSNSMPCDYFPPEISQMYIIAKKNGEIDATYFSRAIDAMINCQYSPTDWHYHALALARMTLTHEKDANFDRLHRLYQKAYELNEGSCSGSEQFRNELLLLLYSYR